MPQPTPAPRRRPMTGWAVVLSGLAACGSQAGAPETEDRAAYLESVRQQPRDAVAAAAACSRIASEALRGECTALVARDLAAAGGDAWSACRGLESGGWRDLCTFEAIDGAGDFGEAVVRACASTGEYQARCLDHALVRHASHEWAALQPGDAAAMVLWLNQQTEEYGISDHRERTVRSIAGRAIAEGVRRQSPGGDFSLEACAEVEPAVCEAAFGAFLRSLSRADGFARLCREGISAQRLREARLPAWQDGVVDDIPGVLGEVCRARTGAAPLVLVDAG